MKLPIKTKIKKENRLYNGISSKLMNRIYDGLILRDDTIIKQKWWAIFSSHLARTCESIERRQNEKN